jgi:ribosome-associated protein
MIAVDCSSAPPAPLSESCPMKERRLPDDPPPDEAARPSRSARKREAEGRQRLGERLLGLKPQQLKRFDLPPLLLEAILETQRLRSRAAHARARQYVGRLMRDIDPLPIERVLAEHASDLKARNVKMPR